LDVTVERCASTNAQHLFSVFPWNTTVESSNQRSSASQTVNPAARTELATAEFGEFSFDYEKEKTETTKGTKYHEGITS
jgi:hypothetical protein